MDVGSSATFNSKKHASKQPGKQARQAAQPPARVASLQALFLYAGAPSNTKGK